MNSALRKIRHQPLAKASGMVNVRALPKGGRNRDGAQYIAKPEGDLQSLVCAEGDCPVS
jgi:hypothetical protein